MEPMDVKHPIGETDERAEHVGRPQAGRLAGLAIAAVLLGAGLAACSDEDGDGAVLDEEIGEIDDELEEVGEEAEEDLEEVGGEIQEEIDEAEEETDD